MLVEGIESITRANHAWSVEQYGNLRGDARTLTKSTHNKLVHGQALQEPA